MQTGVMTRTKALTLLREYVHKCEMVKLMTTDSDLDEMDRKIVYSIRDRYRMQREKLKEELLKAMGVG